MATAEELLCVATDPILTIDVMSRKITIPKAISLLGVESDESVQKLKFSMPRFYNGIDFSTYDIRINYENANKEGDVSPAADVTVTSDTITFTWIVGRFAVMYEGDVTFVVCLRKIDDDGEIVNEFNTIRTTLPVAKGLETDESAVMDANPDVITAIATATLEQAKENGDFTPVKGVDYYTEEERDEFADLIVRDHNGAFANALKGTVSGEVIRVDDVSPIEHTVECNIYGKNLVNPNDVSVLYQETITIDGDDIIIAAGSNLYGICINNVKLVVGRAYTFSSGSVSTHGTNWGYRIAYTDGTYSDNAGDKSTVTLTISKPVTSVNFYIGYGFASENDVVISNIQIEEGSVATDYEPHIDPTTVTVTGCGKNLFNKAAVTSNYTLAADGTLTKAENNGVYVSDYIKVMAGATYYCTATSSHRAKFFDGNIQPLTTDEFDMAGISTGCAFTIPAGVAFVRFTVYDVTLDTVQLELGSEATGYEPYSGTTYTPNEDGSVDIPSVSPTMTLMTDTAGVTIEAEYSKDINCLHAAEVEKEIGDIGAALDSIIAIQNNLIGGASV